MNDKVFVSSTTIDENTGEAIVTIEGEINLKKGCDDPVVELFRPIRVQHIDTMLFVITVTRHTDNIVCKIFPSNRRRRPQEEFLKVANELLLGNKDEEGIVDEYRTILELYFTEKEGLDSYLKSSKKGDAERCNDEIKKFVKDIGMKMPSRKKPAKPKKTKAQKRADSLKFLEEHPEIVSKSNKKSAK